jgi:D-alanine-D-alanine ligase
VAKTYRVVVLAGGLTPEREVSLRSGRRVADSLRELGHEANVRDVDASLLSWLRSARPDCVIPLLHGGAGEGGALQEILDLADVPFVGSTAAPARTAFDKPIAKQVVMRAGISTPASVTLPADTFRELGAAVVIDAVVQRLGLPLFVKPATGGSALGCMAVERPAELGDALVGCFGYGPVALIEQLVRGIEVAVPVVGFAAGLRALPAVEIRADGGVYDYTARYTAGATEFVVPASLREDTTRSCARAAVLAHESLGLRDLSRSDLIVDPAGQVWFLEANVSPGMTDTSLVPLSASADGLSVGEMYSGLVTAAVTRGPGQRFRQRR